MSSIAHSTNAKEKANELMREIEFLD